MIVERNDRLETGPYFFWRVSGKRHAFLRSGLTIDDLKNDGKLLERSDSLIIDVK